jgi:hypothetical protein
VCNQCTWLESIELLLDWDEENVAKKFVDYLEERMKPWARAIVGDSGNQQGMKRLQT